MTARNRVVREPYATWCGRTPVEIIHGLLPDCGSDGDGGEAEAFSPAAWHDRCDGQSSFNLSARFTETAAGSLRIHSDGGMRQTSLFRSIWLSPMKGVCLSTPCAKVLP